MSRKYKFHNPEGVYSVTLAVQGWVDVFTRNEYKNILIENLAYCMLNKGLELFAWCSRFLSGDNHVHLIARAEEGHTLSDILRDYKKFTSKTVLKAISDNQRESRKEWLVKQFETDVGFRFWRADNQPIELWSNTVIAQKLNYIHQNPVEEGLVFRAEDYIYSSSIDYAGGKGMLEIFVIS
jgi:REP element-mobilizing transposase RayT